MDGSSWDDFISHRIRDPYLDRVWLRCERLEIEYPSERSSRLLSEEGERVVRELLDEVESSE